MFSKIIPVGIVFLLALGFAVAFSAWVTQNQKIATLERKLEYKEAENAMLAYNARKALRQLDWILTGNEGPAPEIVITQEEAEAFLLNDTYAYAYVDETTLAEGNPDGE